MATDIGPPGIDVPPLTFVTPAKSLDAMSKEELQAFVEVWLDTGSALADSFVIAQRNQSITVGIDQIKWTKQANKLDRELTRLQKMMVELRSDETIVKPPSPETVASVDAIAKAVGTLQMSQARGEAALSAVAAALDIAQQVQDAKAPSQAAAAPAPTPAPAVAPAPATTAHERRQD